MRIQFKTNWANRLQALLQPAASSSAPVAPALPASAEWDEAFSRVESYLRAHQIKSRVLLNQLTAEIVSAARALAPDGSAVAPVTIAMQVAQARIGGWLVKAMEEGDWADDRFRARGRLALLLAQVPQQYPELFLSPLPVPAELARQLATVRFRSGPELRMTGMTAAPLEFPIAEAAEEKWNTFNRSAFARATASWLIVASCLGAAWFATR